MLGNGQADREAKELPTLRRHGVLVVEDDDLQREVLVTCLRQWGLTVREAADGRRALAVLREDDAIRLMITDLRMPGMDGFDLLREVTGRWRGRIYTIVLSGVRDRANLVRALDLGARDFWVKPCHPEKMFARLAVLDQVMSYENQYQRLVRDLFELMGEMLGFRDNYTEEHSLRVAGLACRTAERLGFSREELEVLEIGCLVHDIGKIVIPDDVLLKPGRFDSQDWALMKMHPTVGAKFLAHRYPDDRVTEIVLQHHERLDGSGYPLGLGGNEIGPMVRIVAASDVYEALVARRPYKSPMPREKALSILREEVEQGRLDGEAVETLASVVAEWDPLAITRPTFSGDHEQLEAFRRMTYFREPLTGLHNYRYLLALDRDPGFRSGLEEYHLLLLDFRDLRIFNQRWGYLKADSHLDELGMAMQEIVNRFDRRGVSGRGPTAMLFRKGADYLIYTTCPREELRSMAKSLRNHVAGVEQKIGLKARLLIRSHPATCPLEEAVDLLVADEEESDAEEALRDHSRPAAEGRLLM